MTWTLIAAAILSFFFAATALWVSYARSKKKEIKRPRNFEREEFQIDPKNVPEFRPTWRDLK